MAKYIEREQAIGALIKGFAFHGYAGDTAVNIIKDIPSVDVCPYYIYNKHDRGDDSFCRKFNCEVSADVKPVIRCKDCVGWKRAKGQSYGSCEHTAIVTNEDFWCANGVKDDDGEDVEGWTELNTMTTTGMR